jgi:secondary thiamine-phosphate synthase enzyme
MSAHAHELSVGTRGRGFHDLTPQIQAAVRASGVEAGLCTVFVHHTSASLLLCENADPDVRRDLEAFFARLVKDGDPLFRHDAEGPDDMPAHVRAVLTGNSLTVPVREGACDLGTWQGVYLWEHRSAPHQRRVSVTVVG